MTPCFSFLASFSRSVGMSSSWLCLLLIVGLIGNAQTPGDAESVKVQHTGMVIGVAFSPNGKSMASCGWDNLVRLWDLTGKELRQFKGHTAAVYCVSFSPDGKHLVSSSTDRTLRIWDVDTGKEILQLQGHTDGIGKVVYSPDGKTIASSSYDRSVPSGIRLRGRSCASSAPRRPRPTPLASHPMASCWRPGPKPSGSGTWRPARRSAGSRRLHGLSHGRVLSGRKNGAVGMRRSQRSRLGGRLGPGTTRVSEDTPAPSGASPSRRTDASWRQGGATRK